jgi:hypothetical protein
MINASLLTNEEREWLNDYHKDVLTTVGAVMKEQGRYATGLSALSSHVVPLSAEEGPAQLPCG